MKTILLITDGFPYGTSEQSFLQTEYKVLSEQFRMVILARNPRSEEIHKGYEKEKVFRCADITDKKLLLKALRNKDTVSELLNAAKTDVRTGRRIEMLQEIRRYANNAYTLMPLIKKIVIEEKVDIIYTYWCTQATLAAVWLKREMPSLKVISRFHGYDLYNERSLNGRQPFRNLMAKKLDALIFVSNAGRDYFENHWGRKGEVHYLGTRSRLLLEENPEEYTIVSCSNLIALKRVELIIDALAQIPGEIKVSWYHFGDGDKRIELENLAAELLKEKDNVKYSFEGFVNNEDLTDAYNRIKPWLFVTTSSTEGMPISILEAFAMGIPCIGTDVGGIPELVVHEHNGFLLHSDSCSTELADWIQKYYYLTKEQRNEYRDNAYRTWREKFDSGKTAYAFAEKLKSL